MDWTAYPRLALVALLVLTNVGLVVGLSASSTAYGPYNADWKGGEDVRHTLRDAGATPRLAVETDAYVDTGGDAVAFVLSPTTDYGPRDVTRVRQFVSRGGTLVVAGERTNRNATNRLLARLDVATRLNDTAVLDEQNDYRNASLPRATNVSEHPLTDGVDALTLNHGTVLNVPERETTFGASARNQPTVLVRTAPVAYLDRNGNGTLDDDEPIGSFPVAAVEPVGSGRVVVVSDASVFTNAMLDREGNAAFVRAVTRNATTTILDYSHRPPLPPLTYTLLVVRGTPLLQSGLALLVLGAVGLWAWRPTIPLALPDALARALGLTDSDPDLDVGLDESEALTVLRSRHPEWDDERLRRVSQHIIRGDREE